MKETNSMMRRSLAILLAFVLCLGLFQPQTLAVTGEEDVVTADSSDVSEQIYATAEDLDAAFATVGEVLESGDIQAGIDALDEYIAIYSSMSPEDQEANAEALAAAMAYRENLVAANEADENGEEYDDPEIETLAANGQTTIYLYKNGTSLNVRKVIESNDLGWAGKSLAWIMQTYFPSYYDANADYKYRNNSYGSWSGSSSSKINYDHKFVDINIIGGTSGGGGTTTPTPTPTPTPSGIYFNVVHKYYTNGSYDGEYRETQSFSSPTYNNARYSINNIAKKATNPNTNIGYSYRQNSISPEYKNLSKGVTGYQGEFTLYYDRTVAEKVTLTYIDRTNTYATDEADKNGAGQASFTIRDCTNTHTNYKFLGWNTDPNATTADYEASEGITITGDLTLYAVWKYEPANPEISVTKTVNGSNSKNPGDTVTFIIQVKNTGNTSFDNVYVSDTLPKGLTYKSATPKPTTTSPYIIWSFSGTEFKPGDTKSVVVQATVNADATGTQTNSVTAAAIKNGDSESTTDSDTADVIVNSATASYTVEYYDAATGETIKGTETRNGTVGTTVSATTNDKSATGYTFAADDSRNVTSATLAVSGTVLKLYFTKNVATKPIPFTPTVVFQVNGTNATQLTQNQIAQNYSITFAYTDVDGTQTKTLNASTTGATWGTNSSGYLTLTWPGWNVKIKDVSGEKINMTVTQSNYRIGNNDEIIYKETYTTDGSYKTDGTGVVAVSRSSWELKATTTNYYNLTEKATVTWYDENGTTVLDGPTEFTKGGTEPSYSKTIPTKAEDENYTYAFKEWVKMADSTEDAIKYKATYTATPKTPGEPKPEQNGTWQLDISKYVTNSSNKGTKITAENMPEDYAIDVKVSYLDPETMQRKEETKTLTLSNARIGTVSDAPNDWTASWSDVFTLPDWKFDVAGNNKTWADVAGYNTVVTITEKNYKIAGYGCTASALVTLSGNEEPVEGKEPVTYKFDEAAATMTATVWVENSKLNRHHFGLGNSYRMYENWVNMKKKADKSTVKAGETVDYTVTFLNYTGQPQAVNFTDTLPQGMTLTGDVKVSGATTAATHDSLNFDFVINAAPKKTAGLNYDPRSTVTVTYTATAASNLLVGTELKNSVTAKVGTASYTDTKTVTVTDNGYGIKVEKTLKSINGDETKTTASTDDVIRWDVKVTNLSNAKKTVALNEMLRDATLDKYTVTLEAGASETVTATYTVKATDDAGTLKNTVVGVIKKTDGTLEGDEEKGEDNSVTIEKQASISVAKSHNGGTETLPVNTKLDYTIDITNNGEIDLYDLKVVDDFANGKLKDIENVVFSYKANGADEFTTLTVAEGYDTTKGTWGLNGTFAIGDTLRITYTATLPTAGTEYNNKVTATAYKTESIQRSILNAAVLSLNMVLADYDATDSDTGSVSGSVSGSGSSTASTSRIIGEPNDRGNEGSSVSVSGSAVATATTEASDDPTETPSVSPTPAPVSPTPAPVSPTPAPVSPTPAPVSPSPNPGDEPSTTPSTEPSTEPSVEPSAEPSDELIDIEDEDTALDDLPDVPSTEPSVEPSAELSTESEGDDLADDGDDIVDIEDEDTALADTPKTGDESFNWTIIAVISAGGLAWLVVDGKKRKKLTDNDK